MKDDPAQAEMAHDAEFLASVPDSGTNVVLRAMVWYWEHHAPVAVIEPKMREKQ